MPALTAELGHFVAGLTLKDIPAEAQAVAKTGITDCFGVMIAGAQDPVVALIDREMAGSDGSALASLIPSLKRRNVEDAALVNGAAAHVLDYDDVTLDGHPSAVLVPAIIAQGETLKKTLCGAGHCPRSALLRSRDGIASAFGLDGSGDSLAEPTLLLVHQLEARELP